MKIGIGNILTLTASVFAAVGLALYVGSGFSAEYGPLIGVEILLAMLIILGIAVFVLSIRMQSKLINAAAPILCMIAMFALVFSFYSMVTPIGYVVAKLNPFSEIARWVYATASMGVCFIIHIATLFFPVKEKALDVDK